MTGRPGRFTVCTMSNATRERQTGELGFSAEVFGETVESEVPTHARYRKLVYEWIEARLCYDGGADYLANFISKHPRERDEDHGRRKVRAIHPNYLRSVIDTHASHLLRTSPTRDFGEFSQYLDDVDLQGTTADDFARDCAIFAQREGRAVAVVDRIDPDGGTARTRAQERAAGRRPFVSLVAGEDFVNWDVDRFGTLNWGVIREVADESREWNPGDDGDDGDEYQYRKWTRAGWELYRWTGKGKGRRLASVASGEHPVGEVPIALLYFGHRDKPQPTASAPTRDLVRMNRRITNLYSLMDEQIYHYVFSLLVVGNTTFDELQKVHWSVQGALAVPTADVEVGMKPFYLAPDVAQVATIQQQITETAAAIRVLSGLGRENEKGADQPSGLALQMMTIDKIAMMKKRAAAMESFEHQLWTLGAKWMRASSDSDEPTIEAPSYTREFIGSELAQALEDAIAFESLRIGGESRIENMALVARRYFADKVSAERLDELVQDVRGRLKANPEQGIEPPRRTFPALQQQAG